MLSRDVVIFASISLLLIDIYLLVIFVNSGVD